MKNKIILIFLISLMIPNLAFASWWNPFSWAWFAPKVLQTPPISDYKANTAASTSTGTTQESKSSEPSKPKVATPIVPKKSTSIATSSSLKNTEPTDPKALLIAKFLKNPTIENFKIFCNEAKNMEGNSTKQVLDSSRENLITVKLTFYDDLPYCKELLDPLNFTSPIGPLFYAPLNEKLLIPFADSDQDWLREAKILYNEKIKDLIKTSKVYFIGFKIPREMASGKSAKSPVDVFRFWEEQINITQQEIDALQSNPNPKLNLGLIIKQRNMQIESAKDNVGTIYRVIYDMSERVRQILSQ